jgi:hypothetical protein
VEEGRKGVAGEGRREGKKLMIEMHALVQVCWEEEARGMGGGIIQRQVLRISLETPTFCIFSGGAKPWVGVYVWCVG